KFSVSLDRPRCSRPRACIFVDICKLFVRRGSLTNAPKTAGKRSAAKFQQRSATINNHVPPCRHLYSPNNNSDTGVWSRVIRRIRPKKARQNFLHAPKPLAASRNHQSNPAAGYSAMAEALCAVAKE